MKPYRLFTFVLFSGVLACGKLTEKEAAFLPLPPSVGESSEAPAWPETCGSLPLSVSDLARTTQTPDASPLESPPVDWEKRRWLEKTVRSLRAGRGFDKEDDIQAWLKLSREQVIDRLMKDPRFIDAVYEFNLYFLGEKRGGFAINPDAVQAATSALSVHQGCRYLSFFDYSHPYYPQALQDPARMTDEELKLPRMELRRRRIADANLLIETVVVQARANPDLVPKEFCAQQMNGLFGTLFLPGYGSLFEIVIRYIDPLFELCASSSTTPAELVAALELFRRQIGNFFEIGLAYDPAAYDPKRVVDLRPIFPEQVGLPKNSFTQMTSNVRNTLTNSSTNYNRKRAASYLKRFFCDDLTPINVENPTDHTKGQHGSNPACFSCHYKLDPMAGFFKDFGQQFKDFSSSETITFDDMATVNRSSYQDSWRAPPAAGREWNIGYVRSVTDESLNDYATSLPDLFRIIQTAPEVKRCVVKRMFEYFVAEDQAIDGGYLDYLASEFIENSKINSAEAFKLTTARLLLSRSFQEPDLVPDQCYDYAPGYDSKGAPPCQVAFLLRRHCVSCHGPDGGAFGGLDLSRWVKGPDGRFTFPHLNDEDEQRPLGETFTRIINRLSTSNPDRRMPLRKHMDAGDREKLYLWANGMVKHE
ncbi:MAG: hypothetical protein AB7P04_14410 [Bacteriovoracia bacterium]